jgi:hypothetical protein
VTISRLIAKLHDLNSEEMVLEVAKCEKKMQRKIVKVKKCINKLINGEEVASKCKKHL